MEFSKNFLIKSQKKDSHSISSYKLPFIIFNNLYLFNFFNFCLLFYNHSINFNFPEQLLYFHIPYSLQVFFLLLLLLYQTAGMLLGLFCQILTDQPKHSILYTAPLPYFLQVLHLYQEL